MNFEIKKKLDLGDLPKPNSMELVHKFESLIDQLYALKTEDSENHYRHKCNKKPKYESPKSLPYNNYRREDHYHSHHYVPPPPPPQYNHYREQPKYEDYPTTTTTYRPYVPYEKTTKPSYYRAPAPKYHEDKSYSYVKSNYEQDEQYYPKHTTPVYTTTTKKPCKTTTTTTERPYEEYRPESYVKPTRYSFEPAYEEYEPKDSYEPEHHYEEPKKEYPVHTEQPYKAPEVPKYYETTTKKYVQPHYTTSAPYTSHSKVKSEAYSDDRPKQTYPEPYYDFAKHFEKEYPQKYTSDFVDYYHHHKEPNHYSMPPKQINIYPCKTDYKDHSLYELPVAYNPNRYESLHRKNSPVHDTASLLKHFERTDLHSTFNSKPYREDDSYDVYDTPYKCTKESCTLEYTDGYDSHKAYDSHDSYYLTKRKTDHDSDSVPTSETKDTVKREKISDWEQTKAIAGNGELYSQVPTEHSQTNSNAKFEIQNGNEESHVDTEYQQYLEKKHQNQKIVEKIWNEIAKIKEELHRRDKLENTQKPYNFNEEVDGTETIVTDDDDIAVRHRRDCKCI